nr:hypothetical protein [uncultured Mediterranean phage uvMED]
MSDRITKIQIDRDVKEIIKDVREFKVSRYFSDVNNFIEYCNEFYEQYNLAGLISELEFKEDKEIDSMMCSPLEEWDDWINLREIYTKLNEYYEYLEDKVIVDEHSEKKKILDCLTTKDGKTETIREYLEREFPNSPLLRDGNKE